MGDASVFAPSSSRDIDENEAPREIEVSFELKLVKSERGMREGKSGLWMRYAIPGIELLPSGAHAQINVFVDDEDIEPGPRTLHLRDVVEAEFVVTLGEAMDVVSSMEPPTHSM